MSIPPKEAAPAPMTWEDIAKIVENDFNVNSIVGIEWRKKSPVRRGHLYVYTTNADGDVVLYRHKGEDEAHVWERLGAVVH